MTTLLLAVFIYTAAFLYDYIRYIRNPDTYRYVSRGTYHLFVTGLVITALLFHVELLQYFNNHYIYEIVMILGGYILMLIASWAILHSGERVCNVVLRSERCITPRYIWIKTKETLFQQLLLLVIALEVSKLISSGFWAVITFMVIVGILQIPQLLHVERFWRYLFIGVMPFIGAILYNCYIHMGYLWPALYVQALVYIFIWITFSDPDAYVGKTTGIGG